MPIRSDMMRGFFIHNVYEKMTRTSSNSPHSSQAKDSLVTKCIFACSCIFKLYKYDVKTPLSFLSAASLYSLTPEFFHAASVSLIYHYITNL